MMRRTCGLSLAGGSGSWPELLHGTEAAGGWVAQSRLPVVLVGGFWVSDNALCRARRETGMSDDNDDVFCHWEEARFPVRTSMTIRHMGLFIGVV
jgi:hypothetical protein